MIRDACRFWVRCSLSRKENGLTRTPPACISAGRPSASSPSEETKDQCAQAQIGVEIVRRTQHKSNAQVSIDFASIKGPHPPVDPESVEAYVGDAEATKFLADETVKAKFASAKKISEVNAKDYDAIFYVGGYAPVIDLPTDPDNIKLATEFYRSGKLVSAVCHGPAALIGVTDAEGKNIFAGRPATAFSNAEEVVQGKEDTIPFLPEDKLVSLGAVYSKAPELWASHVVVDGLVITGQNPGSAQATGEAILAKLTSK